MPIYHFRGVIQPYAWGGYSYLTDLLSLQPDTDNPRAEYWMGAHEKGPAVLKNNSGDLAELIAEAPSRVLGNTVASRFDGRLPFLLKILDVKDMLSIQVHPDKEAAEVGFAAEEEDGPDRSAPDRNYRDDNHKPELGVALTDFYLLHGFRKEIDIRATLETTRGWDSLLPILDRRGVAGLYQHVMELDQQATDKLLTPLVKSLNLQQESTRDAADFWAKRAIAQYTMDGHYDRGLFSIYWFNLVHLKPGEGIFQDAGIPHAYLEGVCIELMANSDNVLRGGLTPKHIDVPELLKHTITKAVEPKHLLPAPGENGWSAYPTPAPDFSLALAQVHEGGQVNVDTSAGPSILLLLKGELQSTDGATTINEENRTVFIPAGEYYTFNGLTETIVYRATVGL